MFNKKFLAFFCFCVLVFLFSSCKSALEREAQVEAEKMWSSYFTRCGDSYFGATGREREYITQIKNPQINVSSKQLTEADKMNGIEWKGTTVVGCKVHRTGNSNDWESCKGGFFLNRDDNMSDSPTTFHLLNIQKIKGKWISEAIDDDKISKPVNCSNSIVQSQLQKE